MKKVFTFIGIALLALCVKPAHAQEDMFLENAFPASGAPTVSNLYLIWLDGSADGGTEQYYGVTPSITADLRPNGTYGVAPAPNIGERFIDVWSVTYTFNSLSGQGAFGQQAAGYLDLSSLSVGWAGGGFVLIPQTGSSAVVDFTGITDDYRFHMDVRKTTSDACRIGLAGGGDPAGAVDPNQKAMFIVGVGDHVYTDPALPNLTPNFATNKWQIIDIPVSQLKTMGWNNSGTCSGAGNYYFTYEFGSVNNNNLQMDGIFFYKSTSTGINNPSVNNKLSVVVTNSTVNILNGVAPFEVYNVAGALVKTSQEPVFGTDELSKGVYIIKSGNAVTKVVIR